MADEEITIRQWSAEDEKRIRDMLDRVPRMMPAGVRGSTGVRDDLRMVWPTQELPAAEYDAANGNITPSKTSCKAYEFDGATGDFVRQTGSGGEREILNTVPAPLSADVPLIVHRDFVSGRWIALHTNTGGRKIGVADSAIPVGGSGTVSIWRKPFTGGAKVDTGENIEDVWHDHITGTDPIGGGDEVVIDFFADENIWRVTGAECA